MSTIKLKKSSVVGKIPGTGDLDYGEIAINYTDGKIYYKTSSNAIRAFIDSAQVQGLVNSVEISSTDVVPEGTTNLYYTSDRVDSDFDARLATKSTTDLSEGNNLYYTTARADSAFDVRLATKSTTNLSEGDNLYYTTARADSDFDVRLTTKSTTDLSEGDNLYYTTARADSDAKAAISVTDNGGDGSLSYNDGVITYTGPSASEVRAHFSGGTGVTITDGTIAIGQSVGTTDDVTFNMVTTDSAVTDNVFTRYIDFQTGLENEDIPQVEGRVFYNDEYKALTVYNDITGSTLQVGHEEWVRVYNNTGSTIANGTPVYITGATGETPNVAPADATTEIHAQVLGLATNDILNASEGLVTVRGLVSGIDTSSLTAGDRVHLGDSGGYTDNPESYPYFPVDLGTCIVSDSSNGYIYVDIKEHHAEVLRVTGNSHLDGNLTIDGDLTVNGSQSIVSQANLAIDNSFVYLNSGDTIGSANTNFTGTGLDDAYFTGHYEGTTTRNFYVRIDGVGTGTGGVDTFEWSLDNFSTTEATGVDITGSNQELRYGINIFFNATTGHTSGDKWDGQAAPLNVDTGWFSNRNTGTSGVGYTHLGIFYDVSDEKFKVVNEYDPEPTGTIDTTDSSYSLGTLVATTFEGNLTGNVTGDLTGTASNATALVNGRTIGMTGDVTWTSQSFDGTSNVTGTSTLATVNSNTGSFGSSSQVATFTVNGKGLITAASNTDIDHDALTNFVANEHIDHSSVSITAGSGLTGGGNITATRTLNVGAGTGIDVAADTVSVDSAGFFENYINHDNLTGFVGNEHVDHSTVSITAGNGLTGGGDITSSRSLSIDSSGLTSYFGQTIFDDIKTRDGSGTGLDADLLDGQEGSHYRIDVYDASGTLLN